MEYTLYPNTGQGILTDRTPIFGDVKDTLKISFILPGKGTFIAVFQGQKNEERRLIKDGACIFPLISLLKEQFISVLVLQVAPDGKSITQTWNCESIKLGTLNSLMRDRWEISGGLSDKSVMARLSEIEKQHNQVFDKLQETIEHMQKMKDRVTESEINYANVYNKSLEELKRVITVAQGTYYHAVDLLNAATEYYRQKADALMKAEEQLKEENEIIVNRYNEAIRTINGMDERLIAIEKYYDPTLIK